mmetsp:Transcript_57090/g.133103  ORF Transcript_57090/g.133103 Transcript_57090/m.133103 type:complete len:208 (+) Transcript_57090:1189-1812(+)
MRGPWWASWTSASTGLATFWTRSSDSSKALFHPCSCGAIERRRSHDRARWRCASKLSASAATSWLRWLTEAHARHASCTMLRTSRAVAFLPLPFALLSSRPKRHTRHACWDWTNCVPSSCHTPSLMPLRKKWSARPREPSRAWSKPSPHQKPARCRRLMSSWCLQLATAELRSRPHLLACKVGSGRGSSLRSQTSDESRRQRQQQWH